MAMVQTSLPECLMEKPIYIRERLEPELHFILRPRTLDWGMAE